MAGATLCEAIVQAGERHGVFFVEDSPGPALPHQPTGPRHSWAELAKAARKLGGALQAHGIKAGDPVGIVLPTSPDFLHAFFGALFIGAIPVPLYPPVRLGRLSEYHARTSTMLKSVHAKMILTDARIWRILGPVAQALPGVPCLTIAELGTGPEVSSPAAPDQLALIQFSSGTTVDPKPVGLTHQALLANVRAICQMLFPTRIPPEEAVGASWLPLYHDMGLVGCLLLAADYPGDLHLMRPEAFLLKPALWLRTLSRGRAIVSPAPNFAYALCAERITEAELEGVDLSSWKFALNGAEPVAASTLRLFTERFSRYGLPTSALTPVYGLSEASLAVSFSPPGRGIKTTHFDREALSDGRVLVSESGHELASVGIPLPGMEIQAPTGATGVIRVKGPSLMQGYINRPEATARALQDGWLDTGDLGFFHEGELYIAGRAKDIIILRGKNHAPQDIEQALDSVEGVRVGCSAAVGTGAPEKLMVFVEVREASLLKNNGSKIVLACRSAIFQSCALEAEVLLLEPGTLPRTSSGKIRRQETLKQWERGELAPPDPVTPWLLARALVAGTIAHWRIPRGIKDVL